MRFSQMCRGRRGHLHLGALAFQDIAHFAFKGAITAGTGFDFVVGHGEMFRIERREAGRVCWGEVGLNAEAQGR